MIKLATPFFEDAWDLASKPESVLCPVALVFGSDDYAADVGATRTNSNAELLLARQMVVTTAKVQDSGTCLTCDWSVVIDLSEDSN